MRILITGSLGFVGGHLTEALLKRGGAEVHGLARRDLSRSAGSAGRPKLHICDLSQSQAICELIDSLRPEQIYHLAGYAHAGQSFQESKAAWLGNLQITLNLLDAVARHSPAARILYIGSGLIYGDPDPPGRPQNEDAVLRPASPYAASKAAADLACYQATRAPGLRIVRARPFNHFGPRQSPEYAIGNFARQIAEIEVGRRPPILETGSLEAQRDLTDVRDVVAAYLLLMDKGRSGEAYNVGSGSACTMQTIVDALCHLARVKVTVNRKESLLRPQDTAVVLADAGKLERETGWRRTFTLQQSLADVLDYWRTNLLNGEALA
jgi:GDP-4-dehydro-6-deoxy-D-mannose reductase